MIVLLGSGFALAQSMPQQPSSAPGSAPSTQQPSSTDQQQPSTAPDQSQKPANAPETLPNTDQKKSDDQGVKKDQDQKLPQSDAAPAATGDVQSTIQSAIQKDPTLASANITVDVKNGKEVDLKGTVASKDAKEAAERIAKENAGGLKVKNHLKVASNDHDKDQTAPKPDMSNPKK
ncbi:MAG TPA: BON domain-containing protein [Candidatus Angelobacter sp.]|nr:BON domain-containing protein [Candidatus Angelobacter sp.]